MRFLRHFSLLTALFLATALTCRAQVPHDTRIDTAECNKHKREKVQCVYRFQQKYDSVKGVIPKKAPIDTTSYERYDREGRTIEFCYYVDKKPHHILYSYDSHGRLVRKLTYTGDSVTGYGFKERYVYDDKGLVTRATTYMRQGLNDEVINVNLFLYDKAGRLTTQEEFRDSADVAAGGYHQRTQFFYDERGREILALTFDFSQDTLYSDSTFYGANGSSLSRGYYKQKSAPHSWWVKRVYYRHQVDSLADRVVVNHEIAFYRLNATTDLYRDSSIFNKNGQLMESYGIDQVKKLSYDKSGKYLYTTIYNPAGQPIYKETEQVIYFK